VAEGGYDEESQACFPYPGLVRLAAALFGGPVSPGALSFCGALISLVAFCFALYFVYRIAEEGWGTRAAQGVVLSLACFPTSFFFNAVYTESLFLALSAGAVWAARVRNDLLLDSFLAGLAAATRSVGVLLLIRRIRYDCPSLAGPRILLATGMYATICRVCNCKLGPSAEEDEELYGAAPRGRAQLVSY
jgi:hypothetical protein